MAGYGGGRIGGRKVDRSRHGLELKPSDSVSIATEPRERAKQIIERIKLRPIKMMAERRPDSLVGVTDNPDRGAKLKVDPSVSEAHKFMDSDSSAVPEWEERKRRKSGDRPPEPKLFQDKPGPVVKRS